MNLLITIYFGLLLGLAVSQSDAATVSNAKQTPLNIAVIGAGAAGLCSAKHCLAEGHNVTVYEQSEEIGGVWYYTDEIGKDKYGVPIHSPMYKGLRTNGPYQIMNFLDFPYPTNTTPFPPQADVLKYLHSYANHFELEKVIKLSHLVVRVLPIENNKWEVLVKNLPENTFESKVYDVVFVCIGRESKPFIPNIDGVDKFQGKLIHSHDYRKPEPFHNTSVLVIGAGPSGTDLVDKLSKVASRVIFSRHKIINETDEARKKRQSLYSSNVILKDDVIRFTSTGAEFIDGSHETLDVVFFATGYNISLPFLSVDSGVYIEKNSIQPIYKHTIGVENPIAFIGLSPFVPSVPIIDLQVRFAIKFISGAKKLPTKSEVLKDIQNEKAMQQDRREYVKQLSESADIEPVSEVILNITEDHNETAEKEPTGFRNYRYIIIDDKTYRKEKYIT